MLRKCVSLGNLGRSTFGPPSTTFDCQVADLYGPTTTDGYANVSFLEDTQTPWVRLFIEWPYFWPNYPTAPLMPGTDPAKTSYYPPIFPMAQNYSQVNQQYEDLAYNLLTAKAAKVNVDGRLVTPQVILTIDRYFPRWLNGTDPGSTTETGIVAGSGTLPPDSALIPLQAKPPDGRGFFVPSDFMYYWWIYSLMLFYHPKSPNNPVLPSGIRARIDALEIINEPNSLGASAARDIYGNQIQKTHTTALMMKTAQGLNKAFNSVLSGTPGPNLKLLGPATEDSGDFKTFTSQLIKKDLPAVGMDLHDRDFGWSHHNYGDVEQIGKTIYSLQRMGFPEAYLASIASLFYGPGTQQVRDMLTGPFAPSFAPLWFGWGEPGPRGLFDHDPFIFLTEGGAMLDALPRLPRKPNQPEQPLDPNGESNPVTVALKQLQKYSVGGAAEALQGGGGGGVEMFTNFLFFDNLAGGGLSGLCDQYGPGRKPPASNETAAQYERPAYAAWKKFGL